MNGISGYERGQTPKVSQFHRVFPRENPRYSPKLITRDKKTQLGND